MRLNRKAVKALFQKVSVTPTSAKAGRRYGLLGRQKALVPMGIAANEARKNLFALIEQVNDDRQPIEISSEGGDAVLMSRADYLALEETVHLLRAPANARRLLESLEQARRCP
jgi:antitoxin YefM